MRRLQMVASAPADLSIGGIIGVPEGADLEFDLRLEAVVEGILVSGTVGAPLVGECVRCLDPIEDEILVEVQELYAYPDRVDVEAEEDQAEIVDDRIDLEPAVRDAVVLALPQAPLCRDDCPGLCPQCGARLADDPGHAHESVDSRWAALTGLAVDEQAETTAKTEPNKTGDPADRGSRRGAGPDSIKES